MSAAGSDRRTELLELVGFLEAPPADDRSAAASALLGGADAAEPWTAAAERAWAELDTAGDDPWVTHHLAIATHARAYDLELAADPEAEQYWRAALRYWAALHADDRFWSGCRDELDRGLSRPAAPDVVEAVRRNLPRDLLEPHLGRIRGLVRSDPGRARIHVGIVRDAPFSPDVVAQARADLVRPIVDDIPRALREEIQVALETVTAWLAVDPGNESLLWALLRVLRARVEPFAGDAERRSTHIRRNRENVERLIGTRLNGLAEQGGRALRDEVARFAFWIALEELDAAEEPGDDPVALERCYQHLQLAEQRFGRARKLDPALGLDPLYRIVADLSAEASANAGVVALRRDDTAAAVGHLERSLAGGGGTNRARTRIHLAQALIRRYETAPGPEPGDLVRAGAELDAAEPDAGPEERSVITDLRPRLARRRGGGRRAR